MDKLDRLASNHYVQFFGSIASIVALFITFKVENYFLAAVIFIVLIFAVVLGAIRVSFLRLREEYRTTKVENITLRNENTDLKNQLIAFTNENASFKYAAEQFHKINHDYRDILCEMFSGENPKTERNQLLQYERQILESVCQKAEKIFRKFIEADCMVTVKYITKVGGITHCETHVRSETLSERDRSKPTHFVINDGQNTAFDTAVRVSPGTVSHFYSGDLTKESNYRNQRDDWKRFYLSTIVVPIRYVNRQKLTSDDIGFLCVDTMAINKLNNTFHVHYLAALADQMYNFMNLMRGTYKVQPAGQDPRSAPASMTGGTTS